MQLALIMLENVHLEFQRSGGGQAGRVAIQNLQIDNQLLTTAQPVVLARAFRVCFYPEAALSSRISITHKSPPTVASCLHVITYLEVKRIFRRIAMRRRAGHGRI